MANKYIWLHMYIIETSSEVKLPTIWTHGKAQPGSSSGMEKVRKEEKIREGDSQKIEDAGARKGRTVHFWKLRCGKSAFRYGANHAWK